MLIYPAALFVRASCDYDGGVLFGRGLADLMQLVYQRTGLLVQAVVRQVPGHLVGLLALINEAGDGRNIGMMRVKLVGLGEVAPGKLEMPTVSLVYGPLEIFIRDFIDASLGPFVVWVQLKDSLVEMISAIVRGRCQRAVFKVESRLSQ